MSGLTRRVGGPAMGIAGVGVLLFLCGCQTPGVKERFKPRYASPTEAEVLREGRLSGETREYLVGEGLWASYRAGGAGVIEELGRRLEAESSREGRAALGELCLRMGDRVSQTDATLALAYYLRCAEVSYEEVVSPGGGSVSEVLRILYNQSCSQAAVSLFEPGYDWTGTVVLKGPGRRYVLRSRIENHGFIDPRQFDRLIPASMLDVKGIEKSYVQEGMGGSLVGYRGSTPERVADDPLLSPIGMAVPLTATIHFSADGDEVEIAIHDVLVKDELRIRGRDYDLAADFTLPLALLLEGAPRTPIGFHGMLAPAEYMDSAGLFRIEPYRPRQIPVVFVHGLMASPQVWVQALNELRSDPVLREHYQPYVAYYPTGFPIPYNAAMLRERLARHRDKNDPQGQSAAMRRMVFIGHSMGGILSHLQTRDSGEEVRKLYFDVPLEETTLDPQAQRTLQDLLYFRANPDIERVVFMATPHGGSKIADSPLGLLGSLFIKIPLEIISLDFLVPREEPEMRGMTVRARELVDKPPDSVYGLRPTNPFLNLIEELPRRDDVKYHSIIGVKGNGEREAGSDGVVPYTSAVLDEAVSSKVVKSGHTAITKNSEAIEEVRRILYLHLGRAYEGPRGVEGAGGSSER